MSTSILYHTQGIVGYVYERTYYENGTCIFWIHPKDRLTCCPICGSHRAGVAGDVAVYGTDPPGGCLKAKKTE